MAFNDFWSSTGNKFNLYNLFPKPLFKAKRKNSERDTDINILPMFGFNYEYVEKEEISYNTSGGDYEITKTGDNSISIKERPRTTHEYYTGRTITVIQYTRTKHTNNKSLEDLENKFEKTLKDQNKTLDDTKYVCNDINEYHKTNGVSKFYQFVNNIFKTPIATCIAILGFVLLTYVFYNNVKFENDSTLFLVVFAIYVTLYIFLRIIANKVNLKLRAKPFYKTSKKYQARIKRQYNDSIDWHGPQLASIIRKYLEIKNK